MADNNTNDSAVHGDSQYVYDKKMNCEVCSREFKTKVVKTGKARFIDTDDLLKPIYSGIDSSKYDVIMCPFCGYAAGPRHYGHTTAAQRKLVRDNIEKKFNYIPEEKDHYSYDTAIRRCKMALLTSMVIKDKISEQAFLCLRLAWLYEGAIEELENNNGSEAVIDKYKASMQEYIESSYRGFVKALQTEYPPIAGMDEPTFYYLLTKISCMCDCKEDAFKFGAEILHNKNANAKLKDKTRTLLDELKGR